jgi:hypothetical protein
MKAHYFSLCYLGGEVDLVKLSNHLSQAYPGAVLELIRGNRVVSIPLTSGVLGGEGREAKYQIVCHQFDSGFGMVALSMDTGQQDYPTALERAQQVARGPELTAATVEYFNRDFGTRDAGELFAKLRKPEASGQFRAGPGVSLLKVGLDYFNIGIHDFDCVWLSGGEGDRARKPDWRDLTAGRGLLWAGDTNRFWSPVDDPDLYWDMVAILVREQSAASCLDYVNSWLGSLNQQLGQTAESLGQGNEELWAQGRSDIEAMDMNFLAFNIHLKSFLLGQENLYRRDVPPASLRLIEPAEWEQLSRYRSRRKLLDGLLADCKHTIDRMTQPLDFREFKLLRTGVEQLEARIMLLTVLLVVMELFANFLKQGHWHLKGLLIVLLVAIPGSYILWERTRRGRARRRGRAIYLRNLRSKTEEEARDIDQRLAALSGTPGIDTKTRDHYLGIYQGIRAKIKNRTAEIDAELGDNQ